MSTAISVTISDNVINELNHIVEETHRPTSFHIQKAIESYIQEYIDFQIAFERLYDQSDSIISLHEMRQQLGL